MKNIKKVSKDSNGVITHVLIRCSIIEISEIVERIKNGEKFYVSVKLNKSFDVTATVRLSSDKKHISTTPDGSKINNLDNLPEINVIDKLVVKIVSIWNSILK